MGAWELRKLTELAEYINGYAFAPEDWGSEGLPIIRIEQLKNPNAPSDYFAGKLPEKNIIDDGDLIFSWSASLFLRIWKSGKAALNQHLFKVVEKPEVDRAFLKSFIEFYLPELTKASHGSTMQHITRKELDKFAASFPIDKAEQESIAAVIAALDRAIEQTEAHIAKQQRIKTGLMQDLLTKGIDKHGNIRSEATHTFKDSPLGRIPMEWEVESLSMQTEQITKGESPTWQGFKYQQEGVLFITSENVRDGYLDISKGEKFIQPEFNKKLFRSALKKGDVLINLVGASIARTAIFDLELEANINQAVCSIRPKEQVSPEWLCSYLQLPVNIGRLLGEQVETARANLSLGDIRGFTAAFPSTEEQKRIATLLLKQREHVLLVERHLDKLNLLKAALMHDLLTGERRVTPLLTQAAPQ
ncbi:restriction endonuclease subunit S [Nitrosomonas communis]|uniref:Type I restriction enzyme, S subunit n=1 Tax=Nitrosomonas communis TaxID=44574 RepID=A0A1H2QUH1_9PROT|nr:restriction endonuclease subunit S [Nitrosomonas communis]SDW10837.1 type I restriction enzyme, S subunit [Nitrosomonas communis]